jgi:hypothetical protein
MSHLGFVITGISLGILGGFVLISCSFSLSFFPYATSSVSTLSITLQYYPLLPYPRRPSLRCSPILLTPTNARVPQDPYCEFPHRPLLSSSYPAEYSLLAPLRPVNTILIRRGLGKLLVGDKIPDQIAYCGVWQVRSTAGGFRV